MFKLKAFTVTEITKYLKRVIATDPILNHSIIEGEVSNFTLHSSGHAYFSLKDEESKLSCVMFKSQMSNMTLPIKNGDKVHAKGQISIFERDGKYQLYVQEITHIGVGELHIRFQQLKLALQNEGYFDPLKKKKIPSMPSKIAIITSPTGAAIQDILSVARRRSAYTEILIVPVQVQGEKAASEIAKAIEKVNRMKHIDFIVLARGGGSIEELWAFNERIVADAIYQSSLPIVTGVGHETDFTISDFVADLRAATPSVAAEIAIKSKDEVAYILTRTMQNMMHRIENRKNLYQSRIDRFSVNTLKMILNNKIAYSKSNLQYENEAIKKALVNKVNQHKAKLSAQGERLSTLNPLSVMDRGFGLVEKNAEIVKTIDAINLGDTVEIRLKDGRFKAEVLNKTYLKG